jgi:thioredoxin-like negative regulator of GroEL
MVERISAQGLHKIIQGETIGAQTCVIKFYSNKCDYCHNLKEYFEDISEITDYEGLRFFAFNVADDPKIDKRLKFNGVPTICMIKTHPPEAQIKIITDPDPPHQHTWFRTSEIRSFIERNK